MAASTSLARPHDESSTVAVGARVEGALDAAVGHACAAGCPPTLSRALRYAVFPGGARLRPKLCVVAALASDDARPSLADGAAASIELLHSASLVHDDLPCFDDADTRRGRPSVHAVFGEAMAVLVGDALIVMSFETLARAVRADRDGGELLALLASVAGTTGGIVAGQAWESEASVSIDDYHRAKTASLFEGAAAMGALAARADPGPWRALGRALGRAYQAADDLKDALASAETLGKPVRRDEALGRPTLVRAHGVDGARARMAALIDDALDAVPPCPGERRVRGWVERFAARLELR